MSKKQDIAACLLGIVVAIILWFTIMGRDIQADVVFLKPFHSFQALWRDLQYGRVTGNLFGNILIFVPVGFLIGNNDNLKFVSVENKSTFEEVMQLLNNVMQNMKKE